MDEQENEYVVFNDLKSKPLIFGYYIEEIIFGAVLILVLFGIIEGLNIFSQKFYGIVIVYFVLLFKAEGHSSLLTMLIKETKYNVIEKNIYKRGE